MQAVVADRYGPPKVLRLTDVARPVPKPAQVLLKVRAATVTLGDCELRAFKMAGWIWVPLRLAMGVLRPRQPILGMELAGEVVATGDAVTRFSPGDRVFGSTSFSMGGYAQYKCLPETGAITRIPDGVSFAEAAGIPTGGLNGLHFVRQCNLKPGESVLINGAGGAIGTFAVQLAKRAGAVVAAVDRGDKLAMLSELGADDVIDYETTDFTRIGERWDAIIDVVGKAPFAASLDALKDNGRLFLGNPKFGQMMRGLWANRKRGGKRVLFQLAGESVEDLDELAGLVADGAVRVVIDRHFPLADLADAHAYVEAGNKQGVVVIDIPHND